MSLASMQSGACGQHQSIKLTYEVRWGSVVSLIMTTLTVLFGSQAVQPSKEIRREELEREFRVNQQYLQNASHHRGATPTSSRVETLQL